MGQKELFITVARPLVGPNRVKMWLNLFHMICVCPLAFAFSCSTSVHVVVSLLLLLNCLPLMVYNHVTADLENLSLQRTLYSQQRQWQWQWLTNTKYWFVLSNLLSIQIFCIFLGSSINRKGYRCCLDPFQNMSSLIPLDLHAEKDSDRYFLSCCTLTGEIGV